MKIIYLATGICGLIVLLHAVKSNDNVLDKDGCKTCDCRNITVAGIPELQVNCSDLSLPSIDNMAFPDNVSILLLSNNIFIRVRSFQFSRFQNLKELDLSNNRIVHLDNNGFSKLTKLQKLLLCSNEIHSFSNTQDLFKDLYNLQALLLNNNPIHEYPDIALSNLTSLETLFINGVFDAEFGPGFQHLKKLKYLTLSGNYGFCNITTLRNTTFGHLRYLEYLDISFCNISGIEMDTFSPLTQLQTLDMSRNYRLGFNKFGHGSVALHKTNITTLILNDIIHDFASCVIIKQAHIRHLSNTSLRNLHVDNNEIEAIDPGVLSLLPKTLTFISAQRNKFSYGKYTHELQTLTGLKMIRISGIPHRITFPDIGTVHRHHSTVCESCGDNTDEEDIDLAALNPPPPLQQSYADWPRDNYVAEHYRIFNISLPPNLESIHGNFTQMTMYIGNIYFDAPSLTYLDLSSNLVQFQYGKLRGLESVTYLDLSNNLARQISLDLLVNCTNLQTLNISFNFFGWQITKDTEGRLFQNLRNLKNLVITDNILLALSGRVFKDLHSLEVLKLARNGMYTFGPLLGNMPNLRLIDCSYNQIKWLLSNTMRDIDRIKKVSRNLKLDLRGNALSCTCAGLNTLTWLSTSGVTPDNMTGYICLLANKRPRHITDMNDFRELVRQIQEDCQNNFGLAMGCLAIFIAMSGLLVFALLYRFRWKLRYLYYAARIRYLGSMSLNEEAAEDFAFDAFVSYADEDRAFVISDMRTRLELEGNKSLNIHHRDFMPGEPIVSNIIGAIQNSRKTLVLLSQNFLDSYWCMYELQMAMMESLSTGRDIVIIVMYKSVPAKNIPREFLHFLQSDSYIEYPHAEEDMDTFWRHLTRAIEHR